MVKKISFSVFFIIFTFIFSFSLFSQSPQNTLTITTYYPSPFGVYKELRVKRMAIGDNYYKSSDYCWEGVCSTHISSNTGLIVEDNVGIGTDNPQVKLHVNGRIKALDPVDDDDVATKKYVDATVNRPYIDWSDCEFKSVCRANGKVACSPGYVLVEAVCSDSNYGSRCRLTDVNELTYESSGVHYGCASIKCCKFVTP